MTSAPTPETPSQSEPSPSHSEVTRTLQADCLLDALLDSIPDLIYFKDTQSRFVKCSRSQALRLGLAKPEDIVGKTDFDFFPREKALEFFQDEQQIMKTGIPLINKIEQKTNYKGELVWTSTTKVPMKDACGNIIGLAGVNRDITEQIRNQEALRNAHDQLEQRVAERAADVLKERRLLRTLVDNLPDAIYAKDTEGRKTLANPADLHNMRCKNEAEALGKNDFDLFPYEVAAKFYADDMHVIKTGDPILNHEEYFWAENGSKNWLLSSKLPLRDETGKIVGLIGIGRNITSLKEAEDKLEKAHKQLVVASRQAGMAEVATGVLHNVGNVLNSVNVSTALVTEKLRTSKISGITKLAKLIQSHEDDLGQFFTRDERGMQIPGYLQQMSDYLERERAELEHELACLANNIEHIKQIVTTQQDYARVAGMVESVNLSDLLDDAIKIHGGAYMRHGVTVVREYAPVPLILVDKHRVMQILVNLLSNAKYACDASENKEKRVTLRIKPGEQGRVLMQVEDNGMGVPSDNLIRIFSQGFTTRKNGHGFGLHSGALAAHDMGGTLSVQSEGPGKGSTFTLDLPLTPPENKSPESTFVMH